MGKLIVHNYKDFMATLSKMWRDPPEKYPVELEVNEIKSRRSMGQNSLLHAWLPIIGTGLGAIADDNGKFHIDPQIGKNWRDERIDEYKLWRLQTPLRSDFAVGVDYSKWLGFVFEARLENYHTDGTDALMYKIITKKYLPE